jgi:hypothetical protein
MSNELTYEFYMANATIERDGKNVLIQVEGYQSLLATNVLEEVLNQTILEDCWDMFQLVNDPEIEKEFSHLSEETEREYMEELINSYDQHSFINIKYEFDEQVARDMFAKDVAEGYDESFEQWIDDRKFQALEFETTTKA